MIFFSGCANTCQYVPIRANPKTERMTKKIDQVTATHPDRSTPKHMTAREVISEMFNHILDNDADLCFSA
jgi:hypothetical protein